MAADPADPADRVAQLVAHCERAKLVLGHEQAQSVVGMPARNQAGSSGVLSLDDLVGEAASSFSSSDDAGGLDLGSDVGMDLGSGLDFSCGIAEEDCGNTMDVGSLDADLTATAVAVARGRP